MPQAVIEPEVTGQDAPATAPSPERPEWLPEKFENPEALAQAYAELSKKLGQKAEEKPEEKPEDTPEEKPEEASEERPEGEGEEAGAWDFGLPGVEQSDLNSMAKEFNSNGTLSEVSYVMLEAAGYSKEVVDQFIAGAKAGALSKQVEETTKNTLVKEVKDSIGGEEAWETLSAWAPTGLSAAELTAYNKMIEGSSKEQAIAAVTWLKGKMDAAEGREAKLTGGRTGGGVEQGFRSMEEMRAAQRDPRYRKDPAYQADFERKAAASRF